MRRQALLDLIRHARNVEVDLLERPDRVGLAVGEVLDVAHHARARRKQVQARVLPALARRDETDLEVERDVVLALGLPHAERIGELLGKERCRPTDDAAVELHDDVLAAVDGRVERLEHAERRQEGRNVVDVEVLVDEATLVRKVVEKAAGRAVGRVHRAQEAPRLGQELADRRRLELGEESATVDRPEVRDVPGEVELLADDRVARRLLQVEAGWRHEVARREEVGELGAHVSVDARDRLGDVLGVEEVGARLLSPDVHAHLHADGIKELVDLLLEDDAVQEARHEDLLVLRRVGVVGAALSADERVQLAEHEAVRAQSVNTAERL